MANGHGGVRPGAGRPKGSVNGETKQERKTRLAAIGRLARKVWEEGNPDTRPPEPSENDSEATADFFTLQTMAIVLAARAAGDYKAALIGLAQLEDRTFGRVKQQIEHGEMDGSEGFSLTVNHKYAGSNDRPSPRAVRAVANRRSVAGNGRRARKKVGKNLLRKPVRVRPNDKGDGSG